ncbi:hypothetical protein DL96DRAFT_1704125 [Flagelloscypha sp. PMI_526]|nr:hypothetical protein DL96DRAFT_1704125 [Flagelloscypha sp. PMI_526]
MKIANLLNEPKPPSCILPGAQFGGKDSGVITSPQLAPNEGEIDTTTARGPLTRSFGAAHFLSEDETRNYCLAGKRQPSSLQRSIPPPPWQSENRRTAANATQPTTHGPCHPRKAGGTQPGPSPYWDSSQNMVQPEVLWAPVCDQQDHNLMIQTDDNRSREYPGIHDNSSISSYHFDEVPKTFESARFLPSEHVFTWPPPAPPGVAGNQQAGSQLWRSQKISSGNADNEPRSPTSESKSCEDLSRTERPLKIDTEANSSMEEYYDSNACITWSAVYKSPRDENSKAPTKRSRQLQEEESQQAESLINSLSSPEHSARSPSCAISLTSTCDKGNHTSERPTKRRKVSPNGEAYAPRCAPRVRQKHGNLDENGRRFAIENDPCLVFIPPRFGYKEKEKWECKACGKLIGGDGRGNSVAAVSPAKVHRDGDTAGKGPCKALVFYKEKAFDLVKSDPSHPHYDLFKNIENWDDPILHDLFWGSEWQQYLKTLCPNEDGTPRRPAPEVREDPIWLTLTKLACEMKDKNPDNDLVKSRNGHVSWRGAPYKPGNYTKWIKAGRPPPVQSTNGHRPHKRKAQQMEG